MHAELSQVCYVSDTNIRPQIKCLWVLGFDKSSYENPVLVINVHLGSPTTIAVIANLLATLLRLPVEMARVHLQLLLPTWRIICF